MVVLRVALAAASHLLLAIVSALAAHGRDLDQLRSRSTSAEVAGAIHDVLMYPHDAALRALPRGWLVQNSYLIPWAILLNSLVWGVALLMCWCVIQKLGRGTPHFQDPA
jgi:anti-sigma factor RsiW